MLATNIIKMKENLNKLLDTPPTAKGVLYKAAVNAYYEANSAEPVNFDDDPCGNMTASSISYANDINSNIKDCADKFAKEFCDSLKESGFMNIIADEIDAHIKAMNLVINVPMVSTIISPTGPCTGVLNISNETSNINIT